MTEVTKGDLMFFQNEILSDLKKLESKLNGKIDLSIEEIKEKLNENDTKNTALSEKFDDLTNLLNNNNDKDKNEEIKKLQKFKTTMEDFTSKIRIKTDKLENEIDNTNYKFDKILNWNLTLPGIIGTEKCKFKSLREFLDFTNKTIQTLNTNKDKNNIDLKSYKEKLETNIRSFGLQIDNVTNKFKEFCSNSLKQCEETFMKRCEETDEKVQTLRIENSRFTLELVNECEKLKIQQKDLDQYKNDLENRYSENLKKQDELYKNLLNKFTEYEKEFKVIKSKFTELSEFIKNVRFRKNIGDTVKIQEFREMSKKIDFDNKKINYNEFDIDVPDFIMDNEENIKNYLKENDKKKITNNKLNFNNVQSEIKKYIESDFHRKTNNEDNQNNVKVVSFQSQVKDNKNSPNVNNRRYKSNYDLPRLKDKNNNNSNNNDNNDTKSEKQFRRNYKYSKTLTEPSQGGNFTENYNKHYNQNIQNNYNNKNNKNIQNNYYNNYNYSSHRKNNEYNNFDSKSEVYNNNMNNENFSEYTMDNKTEVYATRENNFDNKIERGKIRNKTQMYNNKYRMNTAPNENIHEHKNFKRNYTLRNNNEKTSINCNKNQQNNNNIEQKDLTYADLANLVNNENENQTKNKNNNLNNNNAYSNFLMKNESKTNKLNKLFNANINKKTYNTNDTNFNIINSNTNDANFNILYNNKSIKSNENNTINLIEDRSNKNNNENKDNNIYEINNENSENRNKIKYYSKDNNKINEVKQFLNISDNKKKKSNFDENNLNKKEKERTNENEILNTSFSRNNKTAKINLEIIENDENINTKEINELVDNLTPKIKYNDLFINNIKDAKNNIKNNVNDNHNNNINIFDSNKININELIKKIDGTQIKMNLLEERTNKKLNDINEQLKSILSKINVETNKKFYHTTNNFYNHNSLEEKDISKALLNTIINKKNNSIPKKTVNNNINSRIRLLKQNQNNNNIKIANHFAPLSMEIDKIH